MSNQYDWPEASTTATINPDPGISDATDPRLHLPFKQGGVYTERVADYSPGVDAISTDQCSAQLVVDFPWRIGDLAAYHCLGYQYADGALLRRVPPLMHPTYNHLRCRQIVSAQGIKWEGTDPRQPQDTLGASSPRPYFARYEKYRLTLNFNTLPFAIKADNEITNESERWVWVRTEGGVEALFVEGGAGENGGNYKFDADSRLVDGTTAISALPFAGGRSIPYAMPRIIATWYDVPTEFISKPGTPYYYDNIYKAQMKVNDAAFLGFPANTLLMDVPTVETRPNPIPGAISTTPSLLANITFMWHLLNPDTDQLGYKAGGGRVTNRGHNMAISKANWLWYPYSLDGSGTEPKRLYREYDFRKLFQKPL